MIFFNKLFLLAIIAVFNFTYAIDKCDEVETIIVNALDEAEKISLKNLKGDAKTKALNEIYSRKSVKEFIDGNPEVLLPIGSNRDFIKKMQNATDEDTFSFDVENSIQKNLNDEVFAEKQIVDALNNRFLRSIHERISFDKELRTHLIGQYKDYKGLRFLFSAKESKQQELDARLKKIYEEEIKKFVEDYNKTDLKLITSVRTDDAQDPSLWFIAGTGNHPFYTNYATRRARKYKESGKGALKNFNEVKQEIFQDINDLEKQRLDLASNPIFKTNNIFENVEGQMVPAKSAIEVFRKTNRKDFKNDDDYLAYLQNKFKKLFKVKIDYQDLKELESYFTKTNLLSPPLFSRERVLIDLKKAEHDLVSVDFSGVGVDNLQAQMVAMSKSYKESKNVDEVIKKTFSEIESAVDSVTEKLNISKRLFAKTVKDTKNDSSAVLFSGDDGMLMPKKSAYSIEDKKNLVSNLAKLSKPGKLRVTFVNSHVKSTGEAVADRSQYVVRAENIQKEIVNYLRENHLNESEIEKLLIAVDYQVLEKGATFSLIVPKNTSTNIISNIEKYFTNSAERLGTEKFISVLNN